MKNSVAFSLLAFVGYASAYPIRQTFYEDGTPAYFLASAEDAPWTEGRSMSVGMGAGPQYAWPPQRPESEELGPPKDYFYGPVESTKQRADVSKFKYPGHIIEEDDTKERKYKVVRKKNKNKVKDEPLSEEDSSEEEEEEADDEEDSEEEEEEGDEGSPESVSEESSEGAEEEEADDFGMDTPSFNKLFPKRKPDGTYSGNIVGRKLNFFQI